MRKAIFDPGDSTEQHSLGRVINGLHFLTNERIIGNELLFQKGDPYDSNLVEESLRNLRRMGIIGDVSIKAVAVDSNTVDIAVETHDKWTLNLNSAFKSDGGIRNFWLSMSDDNFLGNAQHVSLGYNYSSDRANPHGFEGRFVESRLFGTRWGTTLQYQDSEDIRVKTFRIEHPFSTEGTRWAAGLYADDGILRRRKFEIAVLSRESFLPQQHYDGWFALSFGDRTKWRIGTALSEVSTQVDSSVQLASDNFNLFMISVGLMQRRWYKDEFINNMGRVEDVSLGYAANIIVGQAVFPERSKVGSFIELMARYAAGDEKRLYSSAELAASSYFVGSLPVDGKVAVNLLQFVKLVPRNTVVSRLSAVYGFDSSPGTQMTLGSPTGLRGYSAFELSGQRQILVNIEYRMFPDLRAWFFSLGFSAFFDCAAMCTDHENLLTQRFHSALGFGLRIQNEKQQGSGIIRIDIAFNFDRHQFGTLTLTTDQLFSAFTTIGLPLQNVIQ